MNLTLMLTNTGIETTNMLNSNKQKTTKYIHADVHILIKRSSIKTFHEIQKIQKKKNTNPAPTQYCSLLWPAIIDKSKEMSTKRYKLEFFRRSHQSKAISTQLDGFDCVLAGYHCHWHSSCYCIALPSLR